MSPHTVVYKCNVEWQHQCCSSRPLCCCLGMRELQSHMQSKIVDVMSFHFDPTKSWHFRAYALQGLELLLIEYEDQPACTVLKCLTCPQPLRSFGITGEHILLQPEWHYAWVSHQWQQSISWRNGVQWGALQWQQSNKLTLFKHVLPMNRFTIHMLPLSKQVTSLIHILPNSLWLLPLIREISHISGQKLT